MTSTAAQKKRQGLEQPEMMRKIMVRKHGLDEGHAYTEVNTLLEPNNFIPSWEAGDEEKKEVSVALRKLREKYDISAKLVKLKQAENTELKKNIKKAQLEEKTVSKSFGGGNKDEELTQLEFNQVKLDHDFQKLYHTTYQYMLDRMKKDLISLTLTINDLTASLRQKKQIAEEEQRKQTRGREQKLQAHYRLDVLMKNIDREQVKRQERIVALQLSIRNKEQALQKRIERVKRQHAIAEEAANENKDQNEIEARQKYQVSKIWSQFYMKKMAKEMAKYKEIEDAFQQIRACSGNSDVREMVTKFMTREETYGMLHKQVGHFERKYEWLKQKNEEKTLKLAQLQIENDNKKSVQQGQKKDKDHDDDDLYDHRDHTTITGDIDHEGTQEEKTEAEYTHLNTEIEQLQSCLDQINERKKNIQLINDQVSSWADRCANKFATQLNDDSYFKLRVPQLVDKFRWLNRTVEHQLGDIIERKNAKAARTGALVGEDVTEDDSINARDFINDFATDEFVQKNIRVRPQSSLSHGAALGQGREDRSQAQHQSAMLGGSSEDAINDDERKFNADVSHDMLMVRKERKEFLLAQIEKKRAEQEKLDKKRNKK